VIQRVGAGNLETDLVPRHHDQHFHVLRLRPSPQPQEDGPAGKLAPHPPEQVIDTLLVELVADHPLEVVPERLAELRLGYAGDLNGLHRVARVDVGLGLPLMGSPEHGGEQQDCNPPMLHAPFRVAIRMPGVTY
jgi:hypothetical protein